jgi:RNA polymerase sigma-70 factor (ECF subfamily)
VSEDRAQQFVAVYEQWYGAVHAYALRRAGAHAADEIAAETFLIAWRKLDRAPVEALPWLYGVARNVLQRHRSSGGREQSTRAALEHERSSSTSGDDVSDPGLWMAWDRLGPADREVLSLIAWEELTVAEAARALGCSAPVFSVRLHRARRRLERLLSTSRSPRSVQPVEA